MATAGMELLRKEKPVNIVTVGGPIYLHAIY